MESEGINLQASYVLFFPWKVRQSLLLSQQQKCTKVCAVFLPRHALWRLSTQGFTAGRPQGYLLPYVYQNSRLPKGKQVFNINHIVCTNSLGTVKSPLSVTGNTLRAKFPDASQGPTLQAGLSKDSGFRPAMLTIFWRASY